MILSRIILLLTIVAGSIGSAITKENEPFLPVKIKNKNAETTMTSVGLVTTKEKESFLPVENAETETKSGHRRTSTTIGEATKAGKAPSGKPLYSDEGPHRQREHQCTMAPFLGHWIYQNGCDGDPWEVTIKCNKIGRREKRNSGLTCNYNEKKLDEESNVCTYSGNFESKDALNINTDGEGNCELGPITLYPIATATSDEGCLQNHPKLDVKIISVDKDKDELQIYFSKDGGETYYNQDEPRLALRIPGDDADEMNSGGGSSKGGKGKNKNGRRLVKNVQAQLQRKLQCIITDNCFKDLAELRAAVNEYLDTEHCRTNLIACPVLAQKYGWPMNEWCVQDVTDMSYLFYRKYDFNENISKWNVGRVTNMKWMFYNARQFNQDISGWNVSQVRSMREMFFDAWNFNQDVSKWDISRVTDMYQVLNGASSFNQNLCAWADKFPYSSPGGTFWKTSGCTYKENPEEAQRGPFCASDCNS